MDDVEFFFKWFSAPLKMIIRFLSFIFNAMHHIDWFVDIEASFHPSNKSHLLMIYGPCDALLNLVASILLRIFAPLSIRVNQGH